MATSNEFYNAVNNCNWDFIDNFLKNGGDINTSLVLTGPEAGYTALHIASLKRSEEQVFKLIRDYKANVNSVGEDGVQPIHLACLHGNNRVADVLLRAGANPDLELTKELVNKYAKNKKWYDEFGSTMTLLSFAVFNGDEKMSECLLKYNVNIQIRTLKEKTLLMVAIENNHYIIAQFILSKMKSHLGLVNARDYRGWHAVHYFMPTLRKIEAYLGLVDFKDLCHLLNQMIFVGADINATVHSDQNTLLNMVVYRNHYEILKILLNRGISLAPKSRTLYTAYNGFHLIHVVKDIQQDYDLYEIYETIMELNPNAFKAKRKFTIKYILEDISFRREFGLFVPVNEKNLMEQLIFMNPYVKRDVKDYQDFVNETLKTKVISFSDQSMTMYDLVVTVLNERKLRRLLNDGTFAEARVNLFTKDDVENPRLEPIIKLIDYNVEKLHRKRNLLEKVQKIRNLREAIPLPYELVLNIIEFVDNNNLANFIDAFYEDPVS